MRSNAMKTRAVGAMLIGGVLGASSTASAGLTWVNSNPGSFESQNSAAIIQDGTGFDEVNWYGSDAFATGSIHHSGASQTFSGLTSSGPWAGSWSWAALNVGTDQSASNGGQFLFTVTGTQRITVNISAGLYYANFNIAKIAQPVDDVVAQFQGGSDYQVPSSFTGSFDLLAGDYYFSWNTEARFSAFSGEMISFTVPAPGAVALLGAAGLISSRRRKA